MENLSSPVEKTPRGDRASTNTKRPVHLQGSTAPGLFRYGILQNDDDGPADASFFFFFAFTLALPRPPFTSTTRPLRIGLNISTHGFRAEVHTVLVYLLGMAVFFPEKR